MANGVRILSNNISDILELLTSDLYFIGKIAMCVALTSILFIL